MIPKDIHFYWGGGKLSYLQYLSVKSFLFHNPDWTAHMHIPRRSNLMKPSWSTNEQRTEYTGDDWFYQAKDLCKLHVEDFKDIPDIHEVYKSDLIRWKILYEYGGVWSDIDILYTAPIEDTILVSALPEENYDTAIVYDGVHYIIGFFITKPKQQLFKDIYDAALKIVKQPVLHNDYQSIGSRLLKSLYPELSDMVNKYPETKIENLSMSVVYPYIDAFVNDIFFGEDDKLEDDTIGIHWFNGSDIAKIYQNDFDSRRETNCILSRKVKDLECSL